MLYVCRMAWNRERLGVGGEWLNRITYVMCTYMYCRFLVQSRRAVRSVRYINIINTCVPHVLRTTFMLPVHSLYTHHYEFEI